MPLHAAGEYRPDGTTVESQCVLDHVICSYTPSLAALIREVPNDKARTRISALTGGEGLHETFKEANIVNSVCGGKAEVALLSGQDANAHQVREMLRDAHIAHFACHGIQQPGNPLGSRLLFSSTLEMTVEEIMKEPLPNARLAVLLACETAQGKEFPFVTDGLLTALSGDKQLTEESLHIAGTMLFAGFRGAVGTLWPMADLDGPTVCRAFYHTLMEGKDAGVDYRRAGLALHRAICDLKTRVGIFQWATFVHIGQ